MIGPRVAVYNLATISLGRGANVSQNCHLCAGTHDYGKWSMPLVAQAHRHRGERVARRRRLRRAGRHRSGSSASWAPARSSSRDLPAADRVRGQSVPGAEGARAALRVKSCHIVPSLEARHGGPSKSRPRTWRQPSRGAAPRRSSSPPSPGAGWRRNDGGLEIRAFHRGLARVGLPSRPACARTCARRRPMSSITTRSGCARSTTPTGPRAGSARRWWCRPRGMMNPWAWRHHSRRKAVARALIHPGALEAADGWHATSAGEAESLRALGFKQPVCVAPNGVCRARPPGRRRRRPSTGAGASPTARSEAGRPVLLAVPREEAPARADRHVARIRPGGLAAPGRRHPRRTTPRA